MWSEGAHVLVFPYPAQGHMLPMLDLTHQLAIRGLSITILVTPKNLPFLTPLLLDSSSTHTIQTLVFPFPESSDDLHIPAGVENVRHLGNSGNVHMISALAKLQAPIIQWFKSHPTPPVALISDFFLGWTHHLCLHHLLIPRLVFYSSGAFAVSVIHHLWHHHHHHHSPPLPLPLPLPLVVDFPDIPGSPSFLKDHLPSVFRQYIPSDPHWEFLADGMRANTSSWGAVLNSYQALESHYLDHLKNNNPRVFAVGPLCLFSNQNQNHQSTGEEALVWLDGCSDSSVVYVCFGSQKFMSKPQIEALASALEQSGVQFVWAIKADGYGLMPDGFEERVSISGRGMVIKGWAPQVSILNHRAVGGFLSHCGWNSTLEGLVAGVLILCWPMEAEQHLNARLLVDYLKVGLLVCQEGADAVPDPSELGRLIAEAMLLAGRVKMAVAKELRDKALEAVKPGGSSFTDLDELVKELNLLHILG